MPGRLDETRPFLPVNIALLTVSDTRTAADDRSGNTLAELAETAGHKIVVRQIVRDDLGGITGQLRARGADPPSRAGVAPGGAARPRRRAPPARPGDGRGPRSNPPPGREAAVGRAVVDIVEACGEADRDPGRQVAQDIAERMRPRPADRAEERRQARGTARADEPEPAVPR